MKLALQSERYAATGNISGTGIQKSLGTPSLDRLQILIRESVQNSWDARLDDHTCVSFRVNLRALDSDERKALRDVFGTRPPGGDLPARIEASLDNSGLLVLEISDKGTSGLAGPLRADVEPRNDERADFVNFFRNVGSIRDRSLGAGTYGYGKSSLYRMSRCATILAYTRTTSSGRPVTRLMAAAIGDAFDYKRHKYTGRHWWGVKDDDGIVDPLTGADADIAARNLGIKKRGTTEYGTTILVLDPGLEERSSTQAANAIAECLTWFFWPKMLPREDGSPSIQFEVQADAKAVIVPDPMSFPPVEIFAQAMQQARGDRAIGVACERPKQFLGRLGLSKGPRRPRVQLDTGSESSLIPDRSSHVALMRPAELVVKYLKTSPIASDVVEYGGVFVCDSDVEEYFAQAEPPAHDDWIPDFLEGRGRSFVRVALRRIQESGESYACPPAKSIENTQQRSLATIGDALAGVLLGQSGSRVSAPESSPKNGRSGPSAKLPGFSLSDPEPFRFAEVLRQPCAVFRMQVRIPDEEEVALEAVALIVLEGGVTEPAAPDGPRVVGWLTATGDLAAVGPTLMTKGPRAESLFVAVSIQEDSAISVQAKRIDG